MQVDASLYSLRQRQASCIQRYFRRMNFTSSSRMLLHHIPPYPFSTSAMLALYPVKHSPVSLVLHVWFCTAIVAGQRLSS